MPEQGSRSDHDQPVVEEAHRSVPELFNLPAERKERCNMINSPSFLGYTALGAETTASRTELQTDKLEEYFASLMKRGGGGSAKSTPSKPPPS